MPFSDQHLVVQLEGLSLFYTVKSNKPVYSDKNIAVFSLRWTPNWDKDADDLIVIYFRNEDKLIFFDGQSLDSVAVGEIKKNGRLSIYKAVTDSLIQEFKKLLEKYPQARSCLAMLRI
ncbi:MAG TPA: hypothetical protein ENF93_00875 [Ignisphaera sp.]|nr:hypothetical protein [Ignisphaera sp.]